MSRWIPDVERSCSASFISSKLGETPVCFRWASMKLSSSCCLRVSMGGLSRCHLTGEPGLGRTKWQLLECSSFILVAPSIDSEAWETALKPGATQVDDLHRATRRQGRGMRRADQQRVRAD